jgi:hypothetical protein
VGAPGVHGASPSLSGFEGHLGVYLAFESFEEVVTGRLRACSPVGGAAPGDLSRYLLVDA